MGGPVIIGVSLVSCAIFSYVMIVIEKILYIKLRDVSCPIIPIIFDCEDKRGVFVYINVLCNI